MNLTKNALKFSPRKEVCIQVAYSYQEEQILVHVVDKGKGIREDEMNTVFAMFGKVDRTMHLNQEGIGMGLNIC